MRDVFHSLKFFAASTGGAAPTRDDVRYLISSDTSETFFLRSPFARFTEQYTSRISRGHEMLCGVSDDEILFMASIAYDDLTVDELRWTWRLRDDEAVVYDVTTVPHARCRGLYTDALTYCLHALHGRGVTRCWIYSETRNVASLRGIEHAAFTCKGTLRGLRIGPFAMRFGRVEGIRT